MKTIQSSLTEKLVALLVIFCCCTPVVQATDINLASAYADENFHTRNIRQFSDDVRALTDGKVNIIVHPAGKLLGAKEIFSGVRSGKAEAGEVSMSTLAKEHIMFGVDSLPFIVSGYDDASRLWAASRPMIDKALNERGLQLLYAVPWPAQNLFSKLEIKTVRDFKGVTMRTYNPVTERLADLLAARQVTIQASDLPQAIADDKFDLMFASSATGVDTKAWSKLRYYYKISAWIPKNMVFMDKHVFEKLGVQNQKIILRAAAAAEQRGWKLSQESDAYSENQLVQNKMRVANLDFSLRNAFDLMGEKLAREWLKNASPDELMVLLKYTTDRSMNAAKR